MGSRSTDDRQLGVVCLQDDPATQWAAPGSPRDLHQQLKGSLGGAEIGEIECGVRTDDADQRHAGQIQTLGNHLGTYQDVGSSLNEVLQKGCVAASPSCRIHIPAEGAGAGEQFAHHRFYPFGAHAEEANAAALTGRALVGVGLAAVAVVAKQHFFSSVIS